MNKDKELEESIKTLKIIANKSDQPFKFATETVLQALEDKEKVINEMSEYLAIVRDCPNEDKGANLDCENRCSNDDSIYAECWKLYFEKKLRRNSLWN